jgi:hypothetical protein
MPVSARLSGLPAALGTAIESSRFREYLASGYGTCTVIASAMNKEPKVATAALRQMIRTRLAAGSLFPIDGTVVAGRATGKLCTLCRMPISQGDIEHEVVVGPTTTFTHWDCYSIWRQESDALARTPQHSAKTLTQLHIDRVGGDGINPPTAEYVVSFGGAKDGVGTVVLAKPQGFDALVVLLRGLSIAHAEIGTACHVLTEQAHHEISDVTLTPAVLRRFRL